MTKNESAKNFGTSLYFFAFCAPNDTNYTCAGQKARHNGQRPDNVGLAERSSGRFSYKNSEWYLSI